MFRYILIGISALILSPAWAEQSNGDAAAGAALFAQQCAVCHGRDAAGNGPMAGALMVQPSDLTSLTSRNNGTFPTARVVYRIDGRDPLVSHGSPMPIWGELFDGQDAAIKAETGQPILTSRPVVDLVAYLETVQD